MRSRIALTIAALAFVLVSCGGGDSGGGEFQGKVADALIESLEDTGIDVDAGCVRDATGQLSDADAKLIFDAGPDGEAQGLSDSAVAAAASIVECIGF
jgi:hypothetical protein